MPGLGRGHEGMPTSPGRRWLHLGQRAMPAPRRCGRSHRRYLRVDAGQDSYGAHREQHACSDPSDRACSDVGSQAGDERHRRHRGCQHSKRYEQPVLQQGGQGGKCTSTTAQIQTGMESLCPAAARTAAPTPARVNSTPTMRPYRRQACRSCRGAGRRWAAERLDTTGEGHKRGHDAAHSEHHTKPRGSIRLTPPEPDEAKAFFDQRGPPRSRRDRGRLVLSLPTLPFRGFIRSSHGSTARGSSPCRSREGC